MSNEKTAYRIEERRTSDGQVVASVATWDGDPLTPETGWDLMRREAARFPERYGPAGAYRLVMVGPKHTQAPTRPARRWGWRR